MSRPSLALPAGLAAALEAQLERRSRKALAESARRLSESYRARRPTSDAVRDETDALAYALTRMPATFAATVSALAGLASEQPALAPASLLDVGCGLGAASYAALEVWPDLCAVEMVDRCSAFLNLAAVLASGAGPAAIAGATITIADIARLPEEIGPRDMVVASYALTEAEDAWLPEIAAGLWARARLALAIIEPGTPRDHARLMKVRERLVALGATIVAPCPHPRPCPLEAPDWCHFSARLPRSRDHKLLKGADAPFEDEKFSCLVAARSGEPPAGRIVAPARRGKAGVSLKVCSDGGISEIFLPKRDKARYERNRRKEWGDAFAPLPEEN